MFPFACTLQGAATIEFDGFQATADNIAVRADDGRQPIILNGNGILIDKRLQLEAAANGVVIVPGDRLILKANESGKAQRIVDSGTPVIEGQMIEYVFSTGTVVTSGGTKVQLGIKKTPPELYGNPQPVYS